MYNPSPNKLIIVYGAVVFLSFFIVIPAGLNLHDMKGNCLLSASGYWNGTEKSNPGVLTVTWGRTSDCNFILFMGVTSLLVSLFFLWRSIDFVCKGHDGTPLYCFVSFLVGIVITIALFSCSFMTSVGYSAWCDVVTGKPGNVAVCWKVDLQEFDQIYGVNTKNFSTHLEIVEFGAWSSSLSWLAATFLSFLKVRYFHKNEELLRGLAFEKDSLVRRRPYYQRIGEDGPSVS